MTSLRLLAPVALAFLLAPRIAAAAPMDCNVDTAHSKIQFTAKTKLFDATGHFGKYSVKGTVDPDDFTKSRFTITIETKSIDTDNGTRDNHLRSDDFFHAEKYPRATFQVTDIKPGKAAGQYVVHGTLTIKDTVTKHALPVEIKSGELNKQGKKGTSLKSKFTLDRNKIGVDWPGSLLLPDIDKNVDCEVELTFLHPSA